MNATEKNNMEEICFQIKKCDVFSCDLSNLNLDVLFALGYAISQKKTIKIFLDASMESTKLQLESI